MAWYAALLTTSSRLSAITKHLCKFQLHHISRRQPQLLVLFKFKKSVHRYNVANLQDAKSWLETSAATGTNADADLRPVTPGNQDATPWGEAKADAAWDGPEQLQLEDGEQYEANDILSIAALDDDFQVVGSKKKKGRQQNASGNTSGGRGKRQGKR